VGLIETALDSYGGPDLLTGQISFTDPVTLAGTASLIRSI
jgi:hypothetical protein